MLRTLTVLVLALLSTGCVAAIGNRGLAGNALPIEAEPLLREQIAAAERIVELREQRAQQAAVASEVGRSTLEASLAEIELEEARIRLLWLRAELIALREREDD